MEPGLEATVEQTVKEDMTAEKLGSGDVSVLGTPAVLALVEAAAVEAVREAVGEGETSVGAFVELSHGAPTSVGAAVRATATLKKVDGRKLGFEFTVADPAGEVARGTHRRVIVRVDEFLRTAEERRAPSSSG
jgi:fluoroacetyl-CoA thioesterase